MNKGKRSLLWRKALMASVLFLATLPGDGQAFSLGELQMQSRPGQPFQAQAPVKLNKDERIASVAIGSAADYALLNLPYSPSVEGLSVQAKEQSGNTVVQLQGRAAIAEDDFFILLRISSNQNTFYPFFRLHSASAAQQENKRSGGKEESVAKKVEEKPLIDPAAGEKSFADKEKKGKEYIADKPEAVGKKEEKVVAKSVPPREADTTTAAMISDPPPMESGTSKVSLPPPERKKVERKEPPAEATGRAAEPAGDKATRYGPVREGENLTEIVHRLKLVQSPSSFFQAVVAIWQKNPDHFIRNNMNGLKSGVMLLIPSQQEIARIGVGEARKLRLSHAMEWKKPLEGQQDMAKVDFSAAEGGPEASLLSGGAPTAQSESMVAGGVKRSAGAGVGGETEELRAILLQLQVITRVLESNQAQQERLEQRISTLEQARKEWEYLRERINSLENAKGGGVVRKAADTAESVSPVGSWLSQLDMLGTGAMALVAISLLGLLALSVGRRMNQQQRMKNLQSLLSETNRQDPPLLRDTLSVPAEGGGKADGFGKKGSPSGGERNDSAAIVAQQLESMTGSKP
ncbi:MAG: hypothetical protein HQM06_07540 [Magnetococcales bacterium]|nr:hypothetical protein [Magnetococcales bacterium]